MKITHVKASNWRNFKDVDFSLDSRVFVVGANASGKSNLLDMFRFLKDIASPGGGLASAIERRGGISKVRSLFAKNNQKGRIVLDIQFSEEGVSWRYMLAIKGQQGGKNLPIVSQEIVERNGETILDRPNQEDVVDGALLTQTHLEQISANKSFRDIAEYFGKVKYFHLVPQIIRDPSRSGNHSEDPFGGDFIAQMNSVPARTRSAWLSRMEKALQSAVPEFQSLKLEVDPAGHPHLVAGYKNWRTQLARQNESDFSDGTLRLIGLLWTLVSAPSNGGVLLLEEPELSLNSSIVRTLPTVLASAQRDKALQVILSTHAPEILDDETVQPSEVLVLTVTDDGTSAQLLSHVPEVSGELAADLPKSEIVEGIVAPLDLNGLISAAASRTKS